MLYDVIVVGLGASGSAAASALARAGKRVLALEAQDRIGGRVMTVPFGDGIVELGAEWIHGTENSSVYDLAIQHKVPIVPQDLIFKMHYSDGRIPNDAIINELIGFALSVVDEPPEDPEPLGQYITRRLHSHISANHPQLLSDREFFPSFCHFMDLLIDNYESSNSWNDVSTATEYDELDGHQHMSWAGNGYKTLFDILLNRYNNGPGLPNLDIRLNTPVTHIAWSPDYTNKVLVTTEHGRTYSASHVIVTVSLGVLKERHSTLFSPPLPADKVTAIETLSIGVMDKIQLLFKESWWPKDLSFFGFMWTEKDRNSVPKDDEWTTLIFGASCPMANRKVLTLWTSGNGAKLVETLPEDVVKRKAMDVLRRFLGKHYNIIEAVDIKRSTWYTNPYTRGSYTYDSISTPRGTPRATLAAPLADGAGVPRVLFAGEATDGTHFSTVHGALHAGLREAQTLLHVRCKI